MPESNTRQGLKQLLDKRGGAGSRGKRPAKADLDGGRNGAATSEPCRR